jgi:hypothetical protein
MLRDVEPNYLIADIMWNAVDNYDAWGRASALGVCISHWKRLGSGATLVAQSRLYKWFDKAFRRAEAEVPKRRFPQPGLDILVAIAGLIRIAGWNKALVTFRGPRYQANFGDCYAVNAMMILRVWQLGLMHRSDWTDTVVGDLLRQAMSNLNEAYLRVFDFLKEQRIDRNLASLIGDVLSQARRSPDEVSLSLDIGQYADCEAFVKFARKRERQARRNF